MPTLNELKDSTLQKLFSFLSPVPNFCRCACVCSKWKRLIATTWTHVEHLWIEDISGKTSRRSPIMIVLNKCPNISQLTIYNVPIKNWAKLLEQANQVKKLVIVDSLIIDKKLLHTFESNASSTLKEIQFFGCDIKQLGNQNIVKTFQFTFCRAEHSYRNYTLFRHPLYEEDSTQVVKGIEHARQHGLQLDTAIIHGEGNILSILAASNHSNILKQELDRLSSPPHVNILYHVIDAAGNSSSSSNVEKHLESIQMILNKSVDVNGVFDTTHKNYIIPQVLTAGTNPLLFAAEKGNLEVFKMLYQNSDVNKDVIDNEGNSVLHIAAQHFSKSITEYLISNSSFLINKTNNKSQTPFICYLSAASKEQQNQDSKAIFDLFIGQANLRSADGDGNTAMHLAAFNPENEALVSKLLETDAKEDLLNENNCFQTPFTIAATSIQRLEEIGKDSILELMINTRPEIISKLVKSPKSSTKTTLTHLLCHDKKNVDILSRVVLSQDKKAFEHRDEKERTPLHIAAGICSPEVVKLLLDSNADPSDVDQEDNTPLHVVGRPYLLNLFDDQGEEEKEQAEEEQRPDEDSIYQITEMLLDKDDKQINQANKKGSKPLHLAAENTSYFSKRLCQLFMTHKANCDALDHDQNTPLLCYILNNGTNPDITAMLVTKDNVNQSNRSGLYPLVAAFNENPKSFKFLRVLIENGADVNVVDMEDSDRPTVLILATESKSNIKIIRLLLEKGADPNAACSSSKTAPLHIACENGMEKVCNALLEHDADPFSTDVMDSLPLVYAVAQGYPAIAEKLIDEHMGGANALLTKLSPSHLDALLLEFIRQNFNLELVSEVFESRIQQLEEMDEEKRPPFYLFEDETSDRVSLIHIVCREGLLNMFETYLKWVSLHPPPPLPSTNEDRDQDQETPKPMDVEVKSEAEPTSTENNSTDANHEKPADKTDQEEKDQETSDHQPSQPVKKKRGRGRPRKYASTPSKSPTTKKKTKKQIREEAKKKKRVFPRWDQLTIRSTEGLKRAIVNVRDAQGNTPLHYCAKAHDANHQCDEFLKKSIVDILVDMGAEVEPRNADGDTPLHFASRRGASCVGMSLVTHHGASKHAVNDYGISPQEEAMKAGFYSFFSSMLTEPSGKGTPEKRKTRSVTKRNQDQEGEGSPLSKRRKTLRK
eukprot:gb/GECH01014250.1/.p1 GENE.gb/GECH01014250.1/~~gb/GECH01014250.1/.p1  ORF type:complete len:1165 (+),score=297.27 gb/GECH01014250.1/:1-3495(+)